MENYYSNELCTKFRRRLGAWQRQLLLREAGRLLPEAVLLGAATAVTLTFAIPVAWISALGVAVAVALLIPVAFAFGRYGSHAHCAREFDRRMESNTFPRTFFRQTGDRPEPGIHSKAGSYERKTIPSPPAGKSTWSFPEKAENPTGPEEAETPGSSLRPEDVSASGDGESFRRGGSRDREWSHHPHPRRFRASRFRRTAPSAQRTRAAEPIPATESSTAQQKQRTGQEAFQFVSRAEPSRIGLE